MRIHTAPRINRSLLALAASATILLLFGGDESSNAGIQGSGRSAISSFGVIDDTDDGATVNGVPFDLSNALIRIDGVPAQQAQLALGQVVLIKGMVNAAGTGGVANQVSFEPDVRGVVSQISVANGAFVVLGQTVRIVGETVFGDDINPASVSGISNGRRVQVSGFRNTAGELIASRIDPVAGASTLKVHGTVQGLNESARTFRINSLTVDYGSASLPGSVTDGSDVIVSGDDTASAGTLLATQVKPSPGLGAAENDRASVGGIITSFTSNNAFEVNGQPVVTDAATRLLLRGLKLALNVPVEVTGTMNGNGEIVASKVEIVPLGLSLMNGLLQSIPILENLLNRAD